MTRRTAQFANSGVAFLLVPMAVFAVLWALRTHGWLFSLETLAYDRMATLYAAADPNASPVAIVGYSESDINHFDQYPASDQQMIELLKRLEDAGARTVAIDIYRDRPIAVKPEKNRDAAADYKAFVDYLLAHENVIQVQSLPRFPSDTEFTPPPKALADNDEKLQICASAIGSDQGGVIRRAFPIWVNHQTDGQTFSLGTLAALKYLGVEGYDLKPADEEESALLIGQAVINHPALPAGFYPREQFDESELAGKSFQWMVDFRGPEKPNTFSFSEVMADDSILPRLKDKLVIVGVTAKSVKDFVVTPFSSETYGFVMHGYIADQLIRWAKNGEAPRTFMAPRKDALWTLTWSIIGAVTGGIYVTRSLVKLNIVVVLEIAVLTGVTLYFLKVGTILPFVPPLLAMVTSVLLALAYMSAIDRRDRKMVQQLIDMHISRPIAEQLLENQAEFFESGKLAPKRMTATVLFSDLKNFTPIAESLDSTALMNWLNDFFEQMTTAVEECGGVVNKFNGDMVMALFGPPAVHEAPDEIARDALNAVRCAVMMRRALAAMNVKWKAQGLPTPLMRIGIYTGPLVAGSLGGKNRVEYTVIGDTVNTASRLESTNKECMDDAIDGTRIIVGDTTCDAINARFHTRALGHWEVKGRAALPVHAVLGEIEQMVAEAEKEARL